MNSQLDEWNVGERVVVNEVNGIVSQQPEIIADNSTSVLCVSSWNFYMFLYNCSSEMHLRLL